MYHRRKPLEEIPHEDTLIWSCQTEGCKSWMRDNFAFETVPTCPLCNAAMVSSMKVLPLIVNTNTDQKSTKKGIAIS